MWSLVTRIPARSWKRYARISIACSVIILLAGLLSYSHYFGPVDEHASAIEFVVEPDTSLQGIVDNLAASGMMRSAWALRIALAEEGGEDAIRPGGYSLSKSMDAWTLAKTLTEPPALAFVTFPPGIRKEQMGDILAKALGWTAAQKQDWNTAATNPGEGFAEGVYYPDTYLIPSDQSPAQIAARLRGRFTDMFAPYAQEAQEKGVEWTDVLTLASIVDREAAKDDKAVVAGILLNRLEMGMKLQADATLQYVKGKEGNWWPQPMSADKYLESAFNTYMHAGLPPHPIDNPSLTSISAVLNPADTDCLYYLHDASHKIHCSLTYAGQLENVNTYLK